jgi:hypothetical protein
MSARLVLEHIRHRHRLEKLAGAIGDLIQEKSGLR